MSESHVHGGEHPHVHTAQEKKTVVNRLSRIIGHLEAVKRMVENDSDCSEVAHSAGGGSFRPERGGETGAEKPHRPLHRGGLGRGRHRLSRRAERGH